MSSEECVVCGLSVDFPPDFVIPDAAGRIGNFVFTQFHDTIYLGFTFCDHHLKTVGHRFPPVRILGKDEVLYHHLHFKAVYSKIVMAVAYDASTNKLGLLLKSGSLYIYSNITEEAANDLLSMQSKGKILHELKKTCHVFDKYTVNENDSAYQQLVENYAALMKK